MFEALLWAVAIWVFLLVVTYFASKVLVDLSISRRHHERVSMANVERTRERQRMEHDLAERKLAALERDVFRPIEDVIREAEQAVEEEALGWQPGDLIWLKHPAIGEEMVTPYYSEAKMRLANGWLAGKLSSGRRGAVPVTWSTSLPAPCEHNWVDVTPLNATKRFYRCTGCGGDQYRPLPPVIECGWLSEATVAQAPAPDHSSSQPSLD